LHSNIFFKKEKPLIKRGSKIINYRQFAVVESQPAVQSVAGAPA